VTTIAHTARTAPSTTTDAVEHLRRADPVMRELIHQVGTLDLRRRLETAPEDHFGALVYGIIAQQIPERMALAIIAHLRARLAGQPITPANLLALEPGELHGFGLAPRREEYVRGLAKAVESGALDLRGIAKLPDDEVVEALTKQRGIGPFTAHQFVLWQLERPDFLPKQDRFLRQAVERVYRLPRPPTDAELEGIAEAWRPYRTLAVHYLLRSPQGMGVSTSWPSLPPKHDDI
jgi:DNA-3-methyladenine glycosylase II